MSDPMFAASRYLFRVQEHDSRNHAVGVRGAVSNWPSIDPSKRSDSPRVWTVTTLASPRLSMDVRIILTAVQKTKLPSNSGASALGA